MRSLKKLVMAVIFMICLTSVAFIGTSLTGMENVQAASEIKISPKKVYISKGKTTKLYINIKGTKSKVKWSSTNKRIATVNSKGIVKGVKKGTVKIIAKVDKKQYSCKVHVETPSISNKNIDLSVGKNVTLKMNGTKQKVTWSSSDKKIASVNKKGIVKGIKKGNAIITANIGGKKYTCKVTVKKNIPISSVAFDSTELNMEIGDSKLLNVNILPENTTDDTTIEWISSDNSIATINSGVVTAKGEGTAAIFAIVGKKSCSCKITVKPKAVEITDFNVPESMVVRLGGVKTISISYAPSNATETFSPSFTSENLNIATVTGEGIISPISLGETNIKVKFKTIEKTIKVTVEKSKQTLINEENQRYDTEVNKINMDLNGALADLQWEYENGYRTESQYNVELQELYLVNNKRLDAALKTHNQNLENINALPD